MEGLIASGTVQRLFSMFPTGPVGIALLVLRILVAATLLVDGSAQWTLVTSLWTLLLFVIPAAALCCGFLTPCCATFCCIEELGALWVTGGQNQSHHFHLVLASLTGAVLAILGPGAYSIDARIFGRRLLTVPSGKKP
jgi:uncharacterized membrane protein YphA (DoxX/SURF4 family)